MAMPSIAKVSKGALVKPPKVNKPTLTPVSLIAKGDNPKPRVKPYISRPLRSQSTVSFVRAARARAGAAGPSGRSATPKVGVTKEPFLSGVA